jgi:hypothetical protein
MDSRQTFIIFEPAPAQGPSERYWAGVVDKDSTTIWGLQGRMGKSLAQQVNAADALNRIPDFDS